MLDPDNPYRVFLEPRSVARFSERENAHDRDNVRETRGEPGDWLVRLIEQKLKGKS
jgi:hypothetical protein